MLVILINSALANPMTEKTMRSAATGMERAFSRQTLLIAQLLGERIRLARREKRWSEAEAAERARISRATLQKIERGGLGVALGLVLEVCTIVGVPILGASDGVPLASALEHTRLKLAVLPKRVRGERKPEYDDDF